jgi:hypothetical protein
VENDTYYGYAEHRFISERESAREGNAFERERERERKHALCLLFDWCLFVVGAWSMDGVSREI